MGYHTREINKGVLGEFSKMREEFEEFQDGMEQEDTILSLCELSDLVGATEMFIKKWDMDFRHIIYGIKESPNFELPQYDFTKPMKDILNESFELTEFIVNNKDTHMPTVVLSICQFFYIVDQLLSKWNLTLHDIKKFSDKTISAFTSGKRV